MKQIKFEDALYELTLQTDEEIKIEDQYGCAGCFGWGNYKACDAFGDHCWETNWDIDSDIVDHYVWKAK